MNKHNILSEISEEDDLSMLSDRLLLGASGAGRSVRDSTKMSQNKISFVNSNFTQMPLIETQPTAADYQATSF